MNLLRKISERITGRLVLKEPNPKELQILLRGHYREIARNNGNAPDLAETGFSVYSQSDEDGLLLFIFSIIGEETKICIEMAAGYPVGANTTNLICNWNWSGFLFEGNERLVRKSREFYDQSNATRLLPPRVLNRWLSRENVNDLLIQEGLRGPVDLLCIDVDGIDYWLWNEIDVISPRVVVIEYANFWPADKSVTVPYKQDFVRPGSHPDFFGCSLLALERLAKKKGYRLIGSNKYGFNAFFLKEDLSSMELPTKTVSDCLSLPHAVRARETRLKAIQELPWVEV